MKAQLGPGMVLKFGIYGEDRTDSRPMTRRDGTAIEYCDWYDEGSGDLRRMTLDAHLEMKDRPAVNTRLDGVSVELQARHRGGQGGDAYERITWRCVGFGRPSTAPANGKAAAPAAAASSV